MPHHLTKQHPPIQAHRLTTRHRLVRNMLRMAAATLIGSLGLVAVACGSDVAIETTGTVDQIVSSTTSPSTATTGTTSSGAGSWLFDNSVVHEISASFSQEDYEAMIQTYRSSDTKDWIEATVTIDGATYQNVGIRLKGNSSLSGIKSGRAGGPSGDVSTDRPEGLPWLIRLDKFVDGQNHDGVKELVVRSNISETALNEAVATELLGLAELASQKAIATRFSVNDSEAVLRLVIEHPDDVWMAANFSAGGALYKAESTGDYSYRGSDPESYDEVFDQEAGKKNADLTPLIDFLDFINNTDDTTFYSTLADRLDVESFATYLAMQELLGNFDDIDGPGNNSYLYYDPATDRFTVVAWDHNLAFGGMGEMGGNAPGADRVAPDSVIPSRAGPGGMVPGRMAPDRSGLGDMGFGPGGKSNKLVERFHANSELEALYEERLADLKTKLFESGVGAEVLARWVALLETQASDLVDAATIKTEAAKIGSYFTTDQAAARGS